MYDFALIDASIGLVIALLTQAIRKNIMVKSRFWPVIPFVLGWLLAVPIIVWVGKGIPPFWVFVAGIFWEGAKAGTAAIVWYDLGYKVVLNKGQALQK